MCEEKRRKENGNADVPWSESFWHRTIHENPYGPKAKKFMVIKKSFPLEVIGKIIKNLWRKMR